MKALTAAVLSLLLALPAAAASEREWIPYRKLVDTLKLDKFYALPPLERDKMILYGRLVPVNKAIAPTAVQLTVVDGAERTPLPPLDAGGRVLLVPNARWLADDAMVWTSLPSGEKMRMSFDLGAVVPDGTQWNYATVMGSLPQANAAIRKAAGALSLFVPTMTSVILKFDQPARITIKARGGEQHLASDAKQHIRLKLDSDLLKENPPVVLSAKPREAEIDSD
jgi:hypothetical protein